jgi:predicted secreted protein
MAAETGKSAKVKYGGGFVANLDAWDLSFDTDMYETTDFSTGTVQSRDFIPGLSTWTANISGNFDEASTGLDDLRAAALANTTGTIQLYISKTEGANYNGNSYISNLGVDAPIDGKVAVSLALQGTGTLTYGTSTA